MSLFSKVTKLIEANVGNQHQNKPEDVSRVKALLDVLDYFDFSKKPEPHAYITREVDKGIKRFQKDNNLRVDGWLKPGGETESALIKNFTQKVSDDIKSEELSAPNIPGTNIPDQGVPEDWMPPETAADKDRARYEIDPDIEKPVPLIDNEILFSRHPDILAILKGIRE